MQNGVPKERDAEIEERLQKTKLHYKSELDQVLSPFDIDKFKQTFKQLVQKSKSKEMVKTVNQLESVMEQQLDDLKTKIHDVQEKIKTMTAPKYWPPPWPHDEHVLWYKASHECEWKIAGFPKKEEAYPVNLHHFHYPDLIKEVKGGILKLKKNLTQEFKEINNHQIWNTESIYIEKRERHDFEKFADFIDTGFFKEMEEVEKNGDKIKYDSYKGKALEKYPEESEQRKQLKMVLSVITNKFVYQEIEKSFNFQAENQIWWKLYTLKTIDCLDLAKFDKVVSKFKELYNVPKMINQELVQKLLKTSVNLKLKLMTWQKSLRMPMVFGIKTWNYAPVLPKLT